MGADYIEQDLQMTSDGALVVLHDDTLERTTRGAGCRGRVIDRTLDEVKGCDAGSWFNERHPARARPEFAHESVPTLDEVFATYAGRARFYIETKNPEDAPGMEEALVALLRRHALLRDADSTGSLVATFSPPAVLLQSFSAESLRALRDLAPGVPRVQLIASRVSGPVLVRQLDAIAEYAHAIGPSWRSVDARVVAAAHERKLAVHPYTVNDEASMRRLMADGVDGLFTDDPALLLRVRGERG
jgi:glycerophosphoryl diester phosphodiesterase